MIEHGLALRETTYGPDHIRVAESLVALGDYEEDAAKRSALLDRALAIAEDPVNGGVRGKAVAAQIHRRLAIAAGRANDNAGTKQHFARELELLEDYAGPDSLEVAVVLINYGQYATRWDFDGGVAMLRRAADILDHLKDPRAAIARGAMGVILVNKQRWQEALPILERNVAEADPDRIPPENYGQMHLHLAIALSETGGDKARVKQLLDQAQASFERAGPDGKELIEHLAWWRKKHHV
jgi:tetratricopeptide (TPR) repeat protein